MSNKKKKGPGTAGPYGNKKREPSVIPVKNPATGNFDWAGKKVNDVNA